MPARPPKWKVYRDRYNRTARELADAAGELDAPAAEPQRLAHLGMTDAEIDKAYFSSGKRLRNKLKREAAVERERKRVQAILAEEYKPAIERM